jgi:hypothetical protein
MASNHLGGFHAMLPNVLEMPIIDVRSPQGGQIFANTWILEVEVKTGMVPKSEPGSQLRL